jgi:dTDP-4-dehydrorhamnose reductase
MLLIFGNGLLGNYMYNYFKLKMDTNLITRNELDVLKSYYNLTLYNNIKKIIEKNKYKYVINCIGDINKDKKNINEFYILNSYFPIMLSNICSELNIILFHPTTDCVYSGYDEFEYSGNFFPNCIDDYGLSKFLGENIDACVIRTSIIGHENYTNKSLVNWILQNKNKEINGFTNHLWNGITCLEYAKFIYNLIINKNYWKGIKHIGSSYNGQNHISKYELIKLISDIYELNINVIPFQTSRNCNRILKLDILIDTDLKEQIKEMKKNYLLNN